MEVYLRTCTKSDWGIILDLRNEFYSRSFVLQDKPLSKEEHYEYMEKQQANPNFHQWMAIIDNNVVGYVRILDSEINIMVVKEYQGKGIGTKMLQLLEKEAKKLNIKKLKGLVRVDNLSSKEIFQKNNYELKLYWFEKDLE